MNLIILRVELCPGVLPNKEVGGEVGPHIKFGDKIWGKVRPSSPNKRKNLGSSVTTRRKSWEKKVPILGSYLKFRGHNLGYLSFIFLEAKFGAPTRISEAKFGAKLPRPPDMKVPPWGVVAFGETKSTHFKSMQDRKWLLGESSVDELYEYKNLGVTKNYVGSFSSNVDDNIEKTRKKAGMLFSANINRRRTSPLVYVKFWRQACLPAPLFGSELFTLTSSQLLQLEHCQS